MLMLIHPFLSSLSLARCGTVVSRGWGWGGKLRAVVSHLTTRLDTPRPREPDLMDVWMFNDAFLESNTKVLQPRDGKITKNSISLHLMRKKHKHYLRLLM